MARNLYRFYLYTVFIALLIFASVALGRLLEQLLTLTPLRGTYGTASPQQDIVQAVVFALIAWAISGLLGGLHYWLIRRDMQNDPDGGSNAIRSFFLNITEGIAAAIAIPIAGFAVLNNLGSVIPYSLTTPTAYAVSTLVLVVILELERRSTQVQDGAAIVFQRLHLYGLQLLTLIYLTFSWLSSFRLLVDAVFFGGRGALETCNTINGQIGSNCIPYNVSGLILNLLWFVLFWLAYGWLVRNDSAAILRFILHFSGFAYGACLLLLSTISGCASPCSKDC